MVEGLRKRWVRFRLRQELGRSQSLPSALPPLAADRQRVFIALAADYGNLGDLAITQAQEAFLRERFPDRQVVRVPISRTVHELHAIKKAIRPDDIVTLVGGGNLGDLYDDIEWLRQLVVKSFPEQLIVSFPQSVSFGADRLGRRALKRAQRVYGSHPRLVMLARDHAAFAFMSQHFPGCRVELAPDVVLSLGVRANRGTRSGIVLALRADGEAGLAPSVRDELIRVATAAGAVRHRDTHIGEARLSEQDASAALASIWDDYAAAELVITDRLHGMIFAVINGTPCVAVDSATGKVSDFHATWLHRVTSVHLLAARDPAGMGAVVSAALASRREAAVDHGFQSHFSTVFDRALDEK